MLNVTELIGFAAGGVDPVEGQYENRYINTASADPWTQSVTVSLAERSDRVIAVVYAGERNSGTVTANTITINSVSATKVIEKTHDEGDAYFNMIGIAYATVPTGTTFNVVIDYSVACNYEALWVYSMYLTSPTVTSASATVTTALSIEAPEGAILLGGAADTHATTNLAVSGDFTDNGAQNDGTYRCIGGSIINAQPGSKTFTVNNTASSLVVAAFR